MKLNNLYLRLIFDAYWKDNLDTSNEKILKPILEKYKINSNDFFNGIKDIKNKRRIKNCYTRSS